MTNRLVLGAIALTVSVARAEPGIATTHSTSSEADTLYVSVGAAVGVDAAMDWLYTGLALEGGSRLSSTWWLHGGVSIASRTGWGTPSHMTVVSPTQIDSYGVRVGPEARRCWQGGAVCAVAGVDVGMRAIERYHKLSGLVLVHRIGLDLGSANLRFRPMVELALGPTDSSEGPPVPDPAIGLTMSFAYQW